MDNKNIEKIKEDMLDVFWSVKNVTEAYEQLEGFMNRLEGLESADKEKSMIQAMKIYTKLLDEEAPFIRKSARKAMRTLVKVEKGMEDESE